MVSLSQQLSAPGGTARPGTLHWAGRRSGGRVSALVSFLFEARGKVVGAQISLCDVPEEQALPFLRPSASSGKWQVSLSKRIQHTPEARKGSK